MTAIKTFVREMVTQSIVPFMERCIATWNDQVASRRRGISGRFISFSKKLTGFGSSRGSSNAGSSSSSGSTSNYDALQGFYRPETPEAVMRKLADFAFMLRDWKLAQSTYDILRADYNDDKAWKYYAGTNEMTAISALLAQSALTTKVRSETVDQTLDIASYSYLNRCATPYHALRSLALGAELLRSRGGLAADDAARWETRILEMNLLGPIGQGLFTQQVAACYGSRRGAGTKGWGSRRRKAAFWEMLAASAWLELKKPTQSRKCLGRALDVYDTSNQEVESPGFVMMQEFLDSMVRQLDGHRAAPRAIHGVVDWEQTSDGVVEAENEEVDQKSHRRSLIGPGVSPFTGVDASPLSPLRAIHHEPGVRDDDFE